MRFMMLMIPRGWLKPCKLLYCKALFFPLTLC